MKRASTLVAVVVLAAGCGSHHNANVVSGSRDGTTAAELDVESGASSITIETADLGSDLYRASTPKHSGVVPQVTHSNGHVRVSTSSHGSGPADLTVQLAQPVTWNVHVDGGASDLVGDFDPGAVTSVDLSAGDSHARLDLPAPKGTLTVRMTGGASDFVVHLGSPAPVRVEIDGGAAHAAIRGVTHTGVAGGTVFVPPDWAAATDRYNLVLTAGVSSLTVS